MFVSGAAVTPSGVREGDPAALAALCTVRGPSVLAYCRQVAGESQANAAAAEAFARFRQAVVDSGDATSLNPEALLISATRTVAADHAVVTAPGHCAAVPRLLAARADRSIPDADLARLEVHLAGCWTCRGPVSRFQAAERAYRDPPEPKLDPVVAEQILAALVAAVPPPTPEPPAAPTPNGVVHLAAVPEPEPEPEPEPDATQVFTVDQPTAAFQVPDVVDYDPADVAADEVSSEPAPAARRARRRAAASLLSGRVRRGKREQSPAPEPPAEAAAVAAATAFAIAPAQAVAASAPPVPEPVAADEAAAAAVSYEAAEYAPRSRERSGRTRSRRRLPLILPIVLVVLAVLIALFVSGVFGGSEPASSPRVLVPAGDRALTAQPAVEVVPGAKSASADAVELAKARDRARQRGETPPSTSSDAQTKANSTSSDTAAAKPTTASAPPPPPPPPPPAAVTQPAATAPPAATAKRTTPKQTGGQKQIDAGSGATGAEQIPPPSDTSAVPDLAPPENVTP